MATERLPEPPTYMYITTTRPNPDWLAALRIGSGFVLLASFVSLWPEYSRLYGPNGLVDRRLLLLQYPTDTLSTAWLPGTWWLPYVYFLLCAMLMTGLLTRLAAASLMFLQYHLFTGTYAAFSYGADYIASSCLFYCLLFPVGRCRSMDQQLFKLPTPTDATLCLRFLQVHVCLIYFFAGFDKLLGITWRNGEALWKAVAQPGFESAFKPDLSFLGAYPSLWVVGGWTVVLLEVSYPLFIWLRPARRYWLWATMGLHIAIALLMGLYFFSAWMMVLNFTAFHVPYLNTAKHPISIINHPARTPATGSETPALAGDADTKPDPADV